RALPGDRPGLTLLQRSPAPGAPSADPKAELPLGVFDNYLLAAADAELLASVGPYTARMLPRRPASSAALAIRFSQRSLSTVVVPALRAFWASYRTTLARQDQSAR